MRGLLQEISCKNWVCTLANIIILTSILEIFLILTLEFTIYLSRFFNLVFNKLADFSFAIQILESGYLISSIIYG